MGRPALLVRPGHGREEGLLRYRGRGELLYARRSAPVQPDRGRHDHPGRFGDHAESEPGVLFLWDYRAEKKAWEGTLDRPVETFNALLALPDGKLLGTATGGDKPELFLFNPATRAFEKRADLPPGAPRDLGLTLGPDGKVYGFTRSCLYRLDPGTLQAKEILRQEDEFEIAGPILGNDIYYAKGPALKSVTLFQVKK